MSRGQVGDWLVTESSQWKEATARGFVGRDSEFHACKLRFNFPDPSRYLLMRRLVFKWLLSRHHEGIVCGFKTLSDAVKELPERFQCAGQFTVYVRSGSSMQDLRSFIDEAQHYLSTELQLPATKPNKEDFLVSPLCQDSCRLS